jgi:hypothetical protein
MTPARTIVAVCIMISTTSAITDIAASIASPIT